MNIIKAKLFRKKIPFSVIFSITSKCNFNCKYCHVAKQKKKDLKTQQIFNIINQLEKAGTQRIGIQGGEPLLRDDIGQIVDYCKKKNIFVTLGTNGSLLKQKIKDVKNVDALVLSFDGPSAHDKYRKKGSYKKLLDAIQFAIKNNITIWNTTVLTKQSIHDIDFILSLAEKMKFKTYFTPLMQIPSTTGFVDELFASKQEYKAVIQKLIKEKRIGRPILNSLSYLKYIYTWPDFRKTQYLNEQIPIKRKIRCYANQFFFHIDTNGDLYPCINMLYKTKGYNILKLGLENALKKSSKKGCNGCSTFSFVELNLLFSFKIEAILNVWQMVK